MAECSGSPQPTRKDALGTSHPSLEPVDSSTPSSAPLSRCTLLRHSSFVRAVCVDALVRICAGGAISDGRPYRDSNASGLADCSRETLTVTVKLLVKSRL